MKKEDLMTLQPFYLQAGFDKGKFEKEISFAWQSYNQNKLLQKCTPESIYASVYNVALTSLSLNPILKHAVLLPRWNNKLQWTDRDGNKKEGGYECSLEPQYPGLIHLAIKSGTVKAIFANLVYEGDDLDMDYALPKKVIKHVPYIVTGKDKGNIKAVYSIAILTDGTELGEVMSWKEVTDIRDRSESWKAYVAKKISSCIWLNDEGEMTRKTIIKRHLKYLSKDKAEDKEQLMKAIELDNEVHGFRPLVSTDQIEYLTQLIEEELRVDDQTLTGLRVRLNNLNFRDEANDFIDHILLNYAQPDQNLGQREIQKQVESKTNQINS
ncbi:MAG: recombinase RecT [Candidatus Paceibacterota bacterium]|jgi:recombination protein RecT